MNTELQKSCELFVQNRDAIKKGFSLENAYIITMCANLYASKTTSVDVEQLKECKKILKANTGAFSNFRAHAQMALLSNMALADDPTDYLLRVTDTYNRLKTGWVLSSEYLVVAAMCICNENRPDSTEEIVQRTLEIYKNMKENHPFLTSAEDATFAALLAMSGLDIVSVTEEMEACFKILNTKFFSGNAVQSLSHVLALSTDDTAKKCDKIMAIFNGLKEKGMKFGTGTELATLGGLALLDMDVDTIVSQMQEVDSYLHSQKGFGSLGIGARQRLMYAALIVMNNNIPMVENIQAAALNGVVGLIIAQQTAMMAAIAASTAASSASS